MVKRCLVAVSAVLILIPVLCFSVFADDIEWTQVTTFSDFNTWCDNSLELYVGGNFRNYGVNTTNSVVGFHSKAYNSTDYAYLKIVNVSEVPVSIVIGYPDVGDWNITNANTTSFYLEPGTNTILSCIPGSRPTSYDCRFVDFITFHVYSSSESSEESSVESPVESSEESVYTYSPFDTTPLFPIISSLYNFITGNAVLIVLFFIGVAVSLGLVAIRIIRKTMWSK